MKARPINKPLFWVGLDYFYGLGLVDLAKKGFLTNFHLICLDDHPLLRQLRKEGIKVFCLEEEIGFKAQKVARNSGHLLAHPLAVGYIGRESKGQIPQIVFFKPSLKIDLLARKFGWSLIGNPSFINKFWENKFNFYLQGQKLGLPVLKGEIIDLGRADFNKLVKKWRLPFLLQGSFGWAGKSSFLVSESRDWLNLGEKRKLFRLSPYLEGRTLINNACILKNGRVLAGPLAYQINRQKYFSHNPLSSCGREWKKGIASKISFKAKRITQKLGKAMFKQGYRGFFGLDFLQTQKDELFLLECNPRLTASSVFYYFLEKEAGLVSLLEHHLFSFGLSGEEVKAKERDSFSFEGGEVVQRNIWAKEVIAPALGQKQALFPKTKKEIIVFNPSSGKKIKPQDECWRLACRREIINSKGEINPEILKVRKEQIKKWFSKKK